MHDSPDLGQATFANAATGLFGDILGAKDLTTSGSNASSRQAR